MVRSKSSDTSLPAGLHLPRLCFRRSGPLGDFRNPRIAAQSRSALSPHPLLLPVRLGSLLFLLGTSRSPETPGHAFVHLRSVLTARTVCGLGDIAGFRLRSNELVRSRIVQAAGRR
jgi:hypothetical protein